MGGWGCIHAYEGVQLGDFPSSDLAVLGHLLPREGFGGRTLFAPTRVRRGTDKRTVGDDGPYEGMYM